MPFAAFTKVLGDAGASVVINGLESGPSCTPRLSQLTIDAQPEAIIAQLAETYFASIRDIFRRPNNAFYRWLSTELKRQDPKGVLVVKNSWCDQWTVETVRLREWCKLPVLELEFTSSTLSLSALSRIEAFIETCR
jgi:benzoyl-CoA reductase/2-hydroxyglutaryl-CoA dehydratase subunit BcrC/BadD/HgdB